MAEKGCRSAPLGGRSTAILAWLAEHGPATVAEVGRALDMEDTSIRGRLVMLGRQGLAECRPNGAKPPRMAYSVTADGRQASCIGDAQLPETE